ncbi:unnamed protein product [Staurois parvus]|uniref:Uncharacterized protein n=1 Tax=Staurois parvus TaxID=386267 RepID=A0ABN9F5Q6_9NEOB|nr:unnamed protein product [Staurois parvus]
MKSAVSKMLEERLAVLLLQVDAVEHDNIKPLDDCQKLLEHGVSTAEDLLREGEGVVSGEAGGDHEDLCHFTKQGSSHPTGQCSGGGCHHYVEGYPCLSAQWMTLSCVARDQICSHGFGGLQASQCRWGGAD